MSDFNFIDATDEKAIERAIKSVVASYSNKKVREDLHVTLVACIEHAVLHKDASKLTNLWERLPVNAPHKIIAVWIGAFTSLRYVKDGSGKKKFLSRDKEGNKVPLTFNLAGMEVPFYDMPEAGKDKKNPAFDLDAATESYVKRIIKASNDEQAKLSDEQRKLLRSYAREVADAEKLLKDMMAEAAAAAPAPTSNVTTLQVVNG